MERTFDSDFHICSLLQEKINYLEEKLKEEEHQRKLFQDRACEVGSILKSITVTDVFEYFILVT